MKILHKTLMIDYKKKMCSKERVTLGACWPFQWKFKKLIEEKRLCIKACHPIIHTKRVLFGWLCSCASFSSQERNDWHEVFQGGRFPSWLHFHKEPDINVSPSHHDSDFLSMALFIWSTEFVSKRYFTTTARNQSCRADETGRWH